MQGQFQEKWKKLLLPKRYGKNEVQEIDKARSPFIMDHDRLIFSDSFRRLAGKTQVHPLSTNDHVHTRLAHSLEVASVGRGLGTRYGYFLEEKGDLPDFIEPYHIGEIVQSACLAHDIGNPPFGHAGEFAIQEWFCDEKNKLHCYGLSDSELVDFQTFDGNAQGFRVINVVENEREQGGFRLTYPTIASVVKYPRTSLEARQNGSKKFNYYQAERAFFADVFTELGLVKEEEGKTVFLRHPFSYFMEAADDICYRIIDMEDARELGILRYEEILEVFAPIWERMQIDKKRLDAMYSDRARMSYLRSLAIRVAVDDVFNVSKEKYSALMQGENILPYLDYAGEPVKAYMKNAKDCFNTIILKHPQKISIEIGSYNIYKQLLDVLIPTVHNLVCGKTPSYREERALSLMGKHILKKEYTLYEAYLVVIDFITGMTDSYATFIANQFAGSGKIF